MIELNDYPSSLIVRPEAVLGRLDEWRFVDTLARNVDPDVSLRIPKGSGLFVRGWALLTEPIRVASGVITIVGGDAWFGTTYGRVRPDVAAAYGVEGVRECGFAGIGRFGNLPLGPHEFAIAVLDGANGYHELARQPFELVASSQHLAGKALAAPGRMRFTIDEVATLRDAYAFDGRILRAKRGDVVFVRGWAADNETQTALGGVCGIFDGDEHVVGVHGLPRIDVSTELEMPRAYKSGFTIRMPTSSLAPGAHSLDVALIDSEGGSYVVVRAAEIELSER
jgi:hypothetical protein